MAEVLLINPSKKRKRRRPGTRARRRIKANPGRRRRRAFFKARRNPSRRRRSSAGRIGRARRFRRNPSNRLMDMALPVAVGAGGALLTDIAMGFAQRQFPALITNDWVRQFAKLGVGAALGMLVGRFVDKSTGAKVAAGALTVTAYDTLKGFAKKAMPTLPLGEASEYPMLSYADDSMGELMPTFAGAEDFDGMGAEMEVDGMGELITEY